MSDFLRNLAGRSLGTLEVVQPRVPSLYEPYRRDGIVPGARPGFAAQDTSSEPAVERGLEADISTARIGHQTHDRQTNDHRTRLRTNAARPMANDRKSARREPEAPSAKGGEPQDLPGPVPPALVPRAIIRPEPIAAPLRVPVQEDGTESVAATVSRSSAFEPVFHAANAPPDGTMSITAPFRGPHRDEPEGIRPLPESQAATKPVFEGHPPSHEMITETFISRTGRRYTAGHPAGQPAETQATAEPPLASRQSPPVTTAVRPPTLPSPAAHQTSPINQTSPVKQTAGSAWESTLADRQSPPVTAAVRPPSAPSLTAHQTRPLMSAVRPPIALRSGSAGIPETPAPSSPPKPSIHVSIGRVEVRAVFPEPPARRAPATRPRSTVSLDDYLNPRSRGKR